jgi:hypothetical protein
MSFSCRFTDSEVFCSNKSPFIVQLTFTFTITNSWTYDADTYLQNLAGASPGNPVEAFLWNTKASA